MNIVPSIAQPCLFSQYMIFSLQKYRFVIMPSWKVLQVLTLQSLTLLGWILTTREVLATTTAAKTKLLINTSVFNKSK